MTVLPDIQHRASTLAAPLSPLILAAMEMADTVAAGDHGRRRAGVGDDFWQYRQFNPGIDTQRNVDWRRSAQSDDLFVRQNEWKTPQVLGLWADRGDSMRDRGAGSKADHATVLSLALAMLALRAGERVGTLDGRVAAGMGQAQIALLAQTLIRDHTTEWAKTDEITHFVPKSQAIIFSDFLGDLDPLRHTLAIAQNRRVHGVLVQVLNRDEIAFPFAGPTVFSNASQTFQHKTQSAADLKLEYKQRLAERFDILDQMARAAGWGIMRCATDENPIKALGSLYHRISARWGGR